MSAMVLMRKKLVDEQEVKWMKKGSRKVCADK